MILNYPIILDGATGTQLQAYGFTGGMCSERWVLEHPDVIQKIQKAYVDAGSTVVYAPTFGANRIKLEENRLYNCAEEYNLRLAALSKTAVQGRSMVGGDMAPTGKFLEPIGDARFEELVSAYTEQAAALEKAGVDLFAVETIMTVPEARAAVLGIRKVSTKPIFVTFTCDQHGRTLTGTDVTAALVILQNMGIQAFGLNCSVGPEQMLTQLKRLQEFAEVPLIAKPNAGLPEVENGKTVYRCTPEEFAAFVPAFADAGVMIFGGCCGTTEAHIRAISDAVKNVVMKAPSSMKKDKTILATEKKVFVLDPDASKSEIITADEDLPDSIDDAMDDDDCEIIRISVADEDELDNFIENQYMIGKPLCILCEDAALLDRVLAEYQGRAMYEGTLDSAHLQPFAEKYGLVY